MCKYDVGMRGGKKAMWLRQNRQLILDYYEQFGEQLTLRQFNLKPSTLDSFFKRHEIDKEDTSYDRGEALAEIAMESARQTKQEVRELKDQYGRFTELVSRQLIDNFFVPLLGSTITLPHSFKVKANRDLLITDLS